MGSKTRLQLEKDANAVVKQVLTEMEALAGMPPELAADPYAFEVRRKMVVRAIWGLFKSALNHVPETEG